MTASHARITGQTRVEIAPPAHNEVYGPDLGGAGAGRPALQEGRHTHARARDRDGSRGRFESQEGGWGPRAAAQDTRITALTAAPVLRPWGPGQRTEREVTPRLGSPAAVPPAWTTEAQNCGEMPKNAIVSWYAGRTHAGRPHSRSAAATQRLNAARRMQGRDCGTGARPHLYRASSPASWLIPGPDANLWAYTPVKVAGSDRRS